MISPAIHFPGTCSEAIHFYEKVFQGTDKHIDYYRNAPSGSGMDVTEGTQDLVMHASMTICGTQVNFSDAPEAIIPGNMICLNVFVDSADAVRRAYDMLLDGGTVVVPLGPQFFSHMYAAVVDRFGVKWQLIS